MLTAGIDLAADPKRTGVCEIDWGTETPTVSIGVVGGFDDDALAGLILRADRTGIDAPLGWPEPFVTAVSTYHDQHEWAAGADRKALSYRGTDLHVRAQPGQRLPLSVSTDKIGVTAMRCAHVLQLVKTRGAEVDRSGTSGKVTEVYPAATLRRWGLDPRGYKNPKADGKRRDLLVEIERRLGWAEPLSDEVCADCTATDHALDALISALVARAAAIGKTDGPGPLLDLARREGWIHLPTCPLDALAGP
jgi:hypothetical protein